MEEAVANQGQAATFLPGQDDSESALLQNLHSGPPQIRFNIICVAAMKIGHRLSGPGWPGMEPVLKSLAGVRRHLCVPVDSHPAIEKPAEKGGAHDPVGDRCPPAPQVCQNIGMAQEPVPERGLPGFSPGHAGQKMHFRNRHIMRADPLTNFAVITELEPISGNRFPLQAESFRIRAGELGTGKKTGGLQYGTVSIADRAFDTLIKVRLHDFN